MVVATSNSYTPFRLDILMTMEYKHVTQHKKSPVSIVDDFMVL